MDSFSKRNNLQSNKHTFLVNKLLNVIYLADVKSEYPLWAIDGIDFEDTPVEKLLSWMGEQYDRESSNAHENNFRQLKRIVAVQDWWFVFDVVERYLSVVANSSRENLERQFNEVLDDEGSEWIIRDCLVVARLGEVEQSEVDLAKNNSFGVPSTHIEKAQQFLSLRPDPDYANCIKESITAVEVTCMFVTGEPKATLGKALGLLQNAGIVIPQALVEGFKKLYGYTSDEGGIRHGGIEFTTAGYDEARYMLVSCSAFVNFLLAKYNDSSEQHQRG